MEIQPFKLRIIATTMNNLKLVKDPKYWLLAIAASLITLHLHLSWRSENADLLGTSLLFWVAVSALVWRKRDALNLESEVFSSIFGALLIAFVLFKSMHLYGYDLFLRVSPFISILGLSLLASGVKGLKQYWQEIFLLSFIAVPPGVLSLFIDLSFLTAKFASFFLWILGFQVSNSGLMVMLPTGGIKVGAGCDGFGVIQQLLGLSFICLVMFGTNLLQRILVPIASVILAFIVNGMRVALLAILAALSNQEAFEYWHTGDGSLIFSMLAVFMFGVFCHFTVLRTASRG